MTIRLTHHCFLQQATGAPGDVIVVPDALARLLVERGGAVVVETAAAAPVVETRKGKRPEAR